jgi:hypothetical protein
MVFSIDLVARFSLYMMLLILCNFAIDLVTNISLCMLLLIRCNRISWASSGLVYLSVKLEYTSHQQLDLEWWRPETEVVVAERSSEMYRGGLDRFKKAQTLEPFSVKSGSGTTNVPEAARTAKGPPAPLTLPQNSNLIPGQNHESQQGTNSRLAGQDAGAPGHVGTQVGGGQSTWQSPDWAIEPHPGVYYLDVLKDGEVIDRINLDKRRHLFGRQVLACDFVLDHQSVSRQHAAVIPHRNGRLEFSCLITCHSTLCFRVFDSMAAYMIPEQWTLLQNNLL